MLLDWSNISSKLRGNVAMENHLSLSLRKLTRRVTDLGKTAKTPPKNTQITMAEQEEDFSALPLPDRFQHKVVPNPPRICLMQTN